jgi:hypothetical protein
METSKGADSGTLGAKLFHLPAETVTAVGSAYSRLRDEFTRRTLPFKDGGLRIVTAEAFMPLIESLRPFMEEYERVCRTEVIEKRDSLAALCQKRQGAMYRGFPELDSLEKKYRAEFSSESITTAADARIEGITESAMEIVRRDMEADLRDRVAGAVEEIGARLMALVNDMAQRLDKPSQKGVRYGGLMDMVRQMCSALKTLNITKDPEISKVIQTVESALTKFPPDSLRSAEFCRAVQRKKMNELTLTLNTMFGKL